MSTITSQTLHIVSSLKEKNYYTGFSAMIGKFTHVGRMGMGENSYSPLEIIELQKAT